MAWQQYPYSDRSPPMGGPPSRPPPHGPPRDGSPGSRRGGDGMHPPPRAPMGPGSYRETMSSSSSSFRGNNPMPPHHEYSRGHPPPPGPPPPRRPYGDSPPHYHYPTNYQGPPPSFGSRPYYGGEQPQGPPDSYDMDMRHSGGCTCKKSKCLKLYCQCFASSLTCGPRCKCQACHNTTMHGPAIEEARRVILERNPSAFEDKFVKDNQPSLPPPLPHEQLSYYQWEKPEYRPEETMWKEGSPTRKHKLGCKCRRSYCLKKYCECFHHGARCGDMCRCINCKNKANSSELASPPRALAEHRPPPKEVLVCQGPRYEPPNVPSPPRAHPMRIHREPVQASHPTATLVAASPERSRSTTHAQAKMHQDEDKENKQDKQQDRMAIMAAVAMTELFGGKTDKPEKTKTNSSKTQEKQPETVLRRVSAEEEEAPPPAKRKSSQEEGPRKRKTPSPTASDDEEVRAVVSSGSSHASASPSVGSQGSREPSPVSRGYPRYYGYYNYPPRGMGPVEGVPPPPPPMRRSPSELGGSLPKSLSFRKICSKCGKTRGEHGELGFGNKCVYQDCGRCGAGVQMHVKAGVPMGYLCTLAVKDGAIPGAAEAYDRKIHDLAVRAELQRAVPNAPRRGVKA